MHIKRKNSMGVVFDISNNNLACVFVKIVDGISGRVVSSGQRSFKFFVWSNPSIESQHASSTYCWKNGGELPM